METERLHSARFLPPRRGVIALVGAEGVGQGRFEAGAGDWDARSAGEVDLEIALPGAPGALAMSSLRVGPIATQGAGAGDGRGGKGRGGVERPGGEGPGDAAFDPQRPLTFFDRGGVED